MSQFRIKNIDHGLPDEWVYKLNDGLNTVGDDIDARDPNELAEAILDTQNIILKATSLPSGAILKANSGLAERITILEGIAGNSTLQDIYANGNTISILAGKALTFGIREEFKLDDSGNLSFKPVTMKVRGSGFTTLDFTNTSITTSLGDLLVGATSPGSKLTLKAENFLYLKDVFLSNPVTLSEPGNTVLSTTSQSLVGAINELKASSFNTSLQAVYGQSSPPKLTTNITQGAVIIEDPNPASVADALRVAGILNVTKKAKLGDAKIGNNTTIKDTTGIVTSDPITTTNKVETPYLSSGLQDLIIQDKRVSFPFSDTSVSDLATAKKSIIGAINELKADILTVGGATTLFNVQHDANNGFHKAITTQAEVGNNSSKRITVKNQSGVDTFTVTGLGDMVATSATVGGLSVVTLLNQLTSHLTNDGTAHSAFAAHIVDPNPHNTVKNILGLTGNIFLSSSDGSLSISTTGNTIDIKFVNTVNLQQTYDNLASTKQLGLGTNGLTFKDSASGDLLLVLRLADLAFKKDIAFEHTAPKIKSLGTLTIEPATDLTLTSTNGDVIVKAASATHTVKVQDVNFSEAGATTIPSVLGTSVLGAFKKIGDNVGLTLINQFNFDLDYVFPMVLDSAEHVWPHIADLHPANEFLASQADFFWANNGPLYYPASTIPANTAGQFLSSGTHTLKATTASSLDQLYYTKGTRLYTPKLSFYDIDVNIAGLADGNSIDFIWNGVTKGIGGLTTAPVDRSVGDFRIDKASAKTEIQSDNTRDNIIATLNDFSYAENGVTLYLKAGIWGDAPFRYLAVGALSDGTTVTITVPAADFGSEAITTTLTARDTISSDPAVAWLEFQADTRANTVALSLAEAINRTTFRSTINGTNGHRCKAVSISGGTIKVEWYKPGIAGRLISIGGGGTSGANVSGGFLTGGNCRLRVYDMRPNRAGNVTATFTTAASGFTSVNGTSIFNAREKTDEFFLSARHALDSTRYAPYYNKRMLGSIEAVSGNLITFKIRD